MYGKKGRDPGRGRDQTLGEEGEGSETEESDPGARRKEEKGEIMNVI